MKKICILLCALQSGLLMSMPPRKSTTIQLPKSSTIQEITLLLEKSTRTAVNLAKFNDLKSQKERRSCARTKRYAHHMTINPSDLILVNNTVQRLLPSTLQPVAAAVALVTPQEEFGSQPVLVPVVLVTPQEEEFTVVIHRKNRKKEPRK